MLNIKKWALIIVSCVSVILGSYQIGHLRGVDAENLRQQEVIHNDYVKNTEAAKATRLAVQAALDKAGADYAEKVAELEGSTDGVIAQLSADNKRLRVKLKAAPTGTSGGVQCVPTVDGKAELDESTSKRLIGITKQGDEWIGSLQETVRILQGKLNAKEAK